MATMPYLGAVPYDGDAIISIEPAGSAWPEDAPRDLCISDSPDGYWLVGVDFDRIPHPGAGRRVELAFAAGALTSVRAAPITRT